MLDYILFFGLIAVCLFCYVLHEKKGKHVVANEQPLFVQELNKCESPIERIVFKACWMSGYGVTCQYPVGYYRLDLAIPRLKIAIECDGKQWHSSPKQKAHDRKRDAYLRSKGWKVLRFSGRQINRNMGSVLTRIESEISKKNR